MVRKYIGYVSFTTKEFYSLSDSLAQKRAEKLAREIETKTQGKVRLELAEVLPLAEIERTVHNAGN